MKKIFTLLFYYALIHVALFAQTPVTLTVSDIADAGDIYVVSNGNLFEDYSLDYTGENVTWDYSFLSPVLQDSVVWLEPAETNVAYFLLWFISDVAEESGQEFSSDFFSIEDIFNFYDRSGSELALKGFAGTVSGIPLPAAYDSPDVLYEFPLTYGTEYSSSSSFTFGIPGFGSWSEDKVRTCDADGWGTIITPLGTYEAVRLHCELDVNDVFEYSGFEIPISYITHEYRWMAPDMGIPVLQVNTQEFFGFETVSQVIYQDTLLPEPVAIENAEMKADIRVQNPVSDNMQITIVSENAHIMHLALKNLQGAVIWESEDIEINSGVTDMSFPINGSASGMYLLDIAFDHQTVALKKLVVLH